MAASIQNLSANQKTAFIILAVVIFMVCMSFAAVPLYRVFCQVTGWGGTTQRAEAASQVVLKRKVDIRFDANVNANLAWAFKPVQLSQELHIGETGLAYYEATNLSDEPLIGSANYNVSPAKAGAFFRKIECFCFTEQLLQPGETMLMPMTYYIDPELADEKNLDDVKTITLSYTFHRNLDAEKKKLATAK